MNTEQKPWLLQVEDKGTFLKRIECFDSQTQYLIDKSYDIAKMCHAGQIRDDGERYFNHPRRTAIILIDECGLMDPRLIITALLHDTGEDSQLLGDHHTLSYLEDTIEERDRVNDIIAPSSSLADDLISLTKPHVNNTDIPNKNQALSTYYNNLRNASDRAILVKMADRLDNLRHMKGVEPFKQKRKLDETRDIYVPLFEETLGRFKSETFKNAGDYLLSEITTVTNELLTTNYFPQLLFSVDRY